MPKPIILTLKTESAFARASRLEKEAMAAQVRMNKAMQKYQQAADAYAVAAAEWYQEVTKDMPPAVKLDLNGNIR